MDYTPPSRKLWETNFQKTFKKNSKKFKKNNTARPAAGSVKRNSLRHVYYHKNENQGCRPCPARCPLNFLFAGKALDSHDSVQGCTFFSICLK
jgi:hypothetical protein